jgi:hypothetical protein
MRVFDLLQVSLDEDFSLNDKSYTLKLDEKKDLSKPNVIVNGTYEISQEALEDNSESFPSDISESELMEMLTDVMSIMLLNKDDHTTQL